MKIMIRTELLDFKKQKALNRFYGIHAKAIIENNRLQIGDEFRAYGVEIPEDVDMIGLSKLWDRFFEVSGKESSINQVMRVLDSKMLMDGDTDVYGLYCRNIIIGYIAFTYYGYIHVAKMQGRPKDVIAQMYIEPQFRRKGLMYNEMVGILTERGAGHYYLDMPNNASKCLFRKITKNTDISFDMIKFDFDLNGMFRGVRNLGRVGSN